MLSPEMEREIEIALRALLRDGVVAYPTDTLYGLGANAFSLRAVQRVFEIKGRRADMALPLLLAEASDIERVAVDIPPLAHALAERFWPGPLTLVLKRSSAVPDLVTGGRDTVAVRVPDHLVPRALARGLGAPITGTSANPSGGADPRTAEDVRQALGNLVDYIINGGPAPIGRPSTVLDLTGPEPRVLRQGALNVTELMEGANSLASYPTLKGGVSRLQDHAAAFRLRSKTTPTQPEGANNTTR
ncbi:MAG: L-threonylcarbamoyladenylate synthase [Chloroflexota bacterium]|nr:L-threonylcarbamoyladenylate synthase [Chloroflexota bacterium]